jgi:pyridoxal 5'-phosphate synthase pdxS subunit
MADPTIVEEVMQVVSIPVMAKARIGHYVEAKVLESLSSLREHERMQDRGQ